MIEFKQVSKQYDPQKPLAVHALDLQVQSGQIFGFLGPNGAGKSTTIKMLVGLLKADSGSITIEGLQADSDALTLKKIIAYVPDETYFYENMTGMRHLNFIADIFGLSLEERTEKIEHFASLFEMQKALSDAITSYSHGMKQKLALMAALMHDSRVLILDEPMVGLDPKAAFRLKEIMRAYADAGKCVFFSTHGMEVAQEVCDRIGIIDKGKLLFEGTVKELSVRRGRDGGTLEQLFLDLTEGEVL